MGFFDSFRRDKKEAQKPSGKVDGVKEGAAVEATAPTSSREANDDERSSVSMEASEQQSQSSKDDPIEEVQTSEDRSLEVPIHESQQAVGEQAELPQAHDTKVIAIINQKGGVGKSTTAINLSAALGEAGKSALLVDLDPQGNATSGLGVEKSQLPRCIYDVLLNDVPVEDVVIKEVAPLIDLVPATINLAGAEVELVSEMARENRLKDAVGSMRGKYDYVFIDCPPSLGLLTVNALVAADQLVIPIQTEFYALEGVTKLLESMKRVKNRLNPSLDIFGILLTMYDGRTTLSRQVAAEVRNYFKEQVFETIIPRTVKLSEAPSYGMPITQYDPLGKGAVSYKNLAKEVIERG